MLHHISVGKIHESAKMGVLMPKDDCYAALILSKMDPVGLMDIRLKFQVVWMKRWQ
jgi:hypothetical protein